MRSSHRIPTRRGFLRGLTAVPLIGGAVALTSAPAAADLSRMQALIDEHHRAFAASDLAMDREEELRNAFRAHPVHQSLTPLSCPPGGRRPPAWLEIGPDEQRVREEIMKEHAELAGGDRFTLRRHNAEEWTAGDIARSLEGALEALERAFERVEDEARAFGVADAAEETRALAEREREAWRRLISHRPTSMEEAALRFAYLIEGNRHRLLGEDDQALLLASMTPGRA